MMRELTATGLTVLALAGLAGTGAALAASPHSGRPSIHATHTDSAREGASSDRSSRDRHRDGKTDAASKDTSSGRSSFAEVESSR